MDAMNQARVFHELERSLDQGWRVQAAPSTGSNGISLALALARDGRRLAFMLIESLESTASHLFALNSQLIGEGFQTLGLFSDNAIPSTTHLPCAQIAQAGGRFAASLINASTGNNRPNHIDTDLKSLARAAADRRLRLHSVRPGQPIHVSATMSLSNCDTCDGLSYPIARAQITFPELSVAPAMILDGYQIGRGLSAQITEIAVRGGRVPGACTTCIEGNQLIEGEATLSSMAALELMRHHRNAWYIQPAGEVPH